MKDKEKKEEQRGKRYQWKVDRVLAIHSLSSTTSQGISKTTSRLTKEKTKDKGEGD